MASVNIDGILIGKPDGSNDPEVPINEAPESVWLYSDEDAHGGTFSRAEFVAHVRKFINERI